MRRREFIGALGGAALWPVAAPAQQTPVIGFLNNGKADAFAELAAAFRSGLQDAGYIDGKNVAIVYRWADGRDDHLPELATDLVRRQVAVIVATGGTASPIAAKAAANRIPIVFAIGGDPVKAGLVASLNRPGGTITGATFLANALLPKQIAMLHEIIPRSAAIGFLLNPRNPNASADTISVASSARTLGHKLIVVKAGMESEIDPAFRTLTEQNAGALMIFPDALFSSQRNQLAALTTALKIPSIYNARAFPAAGGLMSYGTKQADAYHQAGIYAGRILAGGKPDDLPVTQATKFEFVINLKTAKALGVEFNPQLLATADEIIE